MMPGAMPIFAHFTQHFLPQAYNLKAVADYEMGSDSEAPLVRAKAAIENAEEFIVCIEQLLATNSIS
jgi:hypothetical protein